MRKQGCQCEKTAKIWENSKNKDAFQRIKGV